MNEEEIDQFQLLEEKIDNLVSLITALKDDKTTLSEKVQIKEVKIADLSMQIDRLKSDKDRAKQRVVSILEKVEQIDI